LLIDRIYLRNYRVFEEELELTLPPGLVGVYGPNGAGKSTLLESVLWTLWGKARTAKEEVPSSGSHGECIAEVTFEHDAHIYLVRRTISGANYTVKAEAHCDGLVVAEGARDTGRYVHSVLGMDDGSFRASVFAEQKQLAAFSSQGPAERRKLVLALLGVTPLDVARDKVRADARQTAEQHSRLRAMLPDLEEARVAADDSEARAAAADMTASEEEKAATVARDVATSCKERFGALDLVRQEHDLLVLEGKSARSELDTANKRVGELKNELADLGEAEAKLTLLRPEAEGLVAADRRVTMLRSALDAAKDLAGHPEVPSPPPVDETVLANAEQGALAARSELGSAQAERQAADNELRKAKEARAKSSSLSSAEDCPLCGQPLGDAFASVQAHRQLDLEATQARLATCEQTFAAATSTAQEALATLKRVGDEISVARQIEAAHTQARAAREAGSKRLAAAMDALSEGDGALALTIGPTGDVKKLLKALDDATKALSAARRAADEASRLQGRLERHPQAELALADAEARSDTASSLVETLRAKVKALGFDQAGLAKALQASRDAEQAAGEVDRKARAARLLATTARAQADAAAARYSEAAEQHARLGELEGSAVHLGRTSELLNGFRNSVVASVGPRLAVQAAELFGELTDNEYDRLEVDSESYGLQVRDSGISYDLERFSGSEVDLANLALRVAISEHIRFQSGGTVGLLVLDEIFGPLDEERKARMLLALERLKGRFRQILVVTHSTEIKDQLPNAVEVIKRPGRRATARLVEY
jgi:DNA repair protein SbcC/Rad50